MKFFSLEVRDKKGDSLRRHLERVAYLLGYEPRELVEARIPSHFAYIFALFLDLNARRSYRDCPVSWTDLRNWMEVKGLSLRPFEISLLDALDSAFLAVFAAPAAPAAKEPEPCPSK